MDWEYPGALDRGGTVNDKKNFADFCVEFKATVAARGGKRYLLTMATGAGAYGRQGALGERCAAGAEACIAAERAAARGTSNSLQPARPSMHCCCLIAMQAWTCPA